MPFNGKTLLTTELAKREQELLKDGFSYQAIANMTGVKVGTLKERNRLAYHIDIYDAFRQRVDRDGIPNRLSVGDDFGYYFAGFFDGEGTVVAFHRRRSDRPQSYPEFRLALQIALRQDDTNVLEYIAENIGGRIHYQKSRQNSKTNPSSRWVLENIKDLAEIIIPLFDKYPLRSKKAREYQVWRPLVVQRYVSTLGGETARGGPVSADFESGFLSAIDTIKGIRQFPGSL